MVSKLLAALDEDAVKILAATSAGSVPATTIADAFDIPESTLYRRLTDLAELDVLTREPRLDDDNNEYFEYEANLSKLLVVVEDGEVRTRVEFDDGTTCQQSFERPE